jgi:hypothetical protein
MNADQKHHLHPDCIKYKKIIMYAICLHYRLHNSGRESLYGLGSVLLCSFALWLSVIKVSLKFHESLWNSNHFTVSIDICKTDLSHCVLHKSVKVGQIEFKLTGEIAPEIFTVL